MRKLVQWQFSLAILIAVFVLFSCKKTSKPEVVEKPRSGTKWTYNYKTYNGIGALSSESFINLTATEETIANEKWLVLKNDAGATVYTLQEKANGLYQYVNNASYLLAKHPAMVNDSYPSWYNGAAITYTVKAVGDSILAWNDIYSTTYSEGVQNAKIFDKIWYNPNVWFVLKETYAISPFGVYHLDTRMTLSEISY